MQPIQIVCEVLNAIDAHDLDRAARRVAETCVVRDTSMPQAFNKAAFLAQMRSILAAFPDWKYDLESIEAEGKQVTVSVTALATNSAPLQLAGRPAIAATGKRVSVPDKFVFTVSDDQVDSLTIDSPRNGGAAAMLAQLGTPVTSLS